MTVFMFPGQGSQVRGMGRELFAAFPDLIGTADAVLGYSIQALCLDDPQRRLSNTRYTQPALFVVGALAWRAHRAAGYPPPSYLLGHSLGEYNALEAAGVMDFEGGLRLVMQRGALMAEAPAGAMAAVLGLTLDAVRLQIEALGGTLDIANLNGPTQIIVSGRCDEIADAEAAFIAAGAKYIPLNTNGAFHSRQMSGPRAAFASFLQGFAFLPPATPVISNVMAEPYDDKIGDLLAEQLTSPVLWMRSIQYLMDRGEQEFVELGSGRVLTKLLADIRTQSQTPLAPQVSLPESGSIAPDPAALQRRIDAWNLAHPIGARVRVPNQPGTSVTRTPAMSLFGHREAIYLEGFNGYFPLTDIQAAE